MVKQRQKLLSLVDIFHLRLLNSYNIQVYRASTISPCYWACILVWLPHYLLEFVNFGWLIPCPPPPKKKYFRMSRFDCHSFCWNLWTVEDFSFFFLLPWFLHVNCNQWNNGSLIVIGDSNSHIEPFVVDMRIDLHNVLLYINVNINK